MCPARRQRSARGSGADLRAEILSVTKELLAEKGSAEAVSIRMIAKAVGVTAPSIYRHFADKDVLIEAVCAEVFAELEAPLAAALEGVEAPLDRLLAAAHAYVRFALAHPENYRISMMQISDSVTALDMVLSAAAFQKLVELIGDCIAAGIFPDEDPVPMALEAWSAVHGMAALMVAKPYLPWGDQDAFVDRLIRGSVAGACLIRRPSGEPLPPDVLAWAVR